MKQPVNGVEMIVRSSCFELMLSDGAEFYGTARIGRGATKESAKKAAVRRLERLIKDVEKL